MNPVSEEFLAYAHAEIEKISAFLQMKEGHVNPTKLEILCSLGITPNFYWQKEKEPVRVKEDQQLKDELIKIAEEFSLVIDGATLVIPYGKSLEQSDFRRCADKLKEHNYEYKKGKSYFGPSWRTV